MNRVRTTWAICAAVGVLVIAGCTNGGSTAASTTGASAPTSGAASSSTASAAVSSASSAGSSSGSPSSPSSSGSGSGTVDRVAILDQALAELVAMPGGPPGAIAVVQVADKRTVHSAGFADVKTKTPPAVDEHMRIASVAKAFSGAVALSLVQAGKLSLDDTIGKILPTQPAAWAGVTLRQLLSHTGGIPDFLATKKFAAAANGNTSTPPSPAALVAFAADEPLDFPSGTQYEYSNTDNILVGLMVEAVTGKSYADALSEQVLAPLGLDNTSLPVGVEMPEPTIHGYQWDPPAPLTDVTGGLAGGWAWASGGIVSTPADLNEFIRGYVGGKLFGEQVRGEQQDLFIPVAGSEPPGPGLNSASMALFRYQTTCGTVYGHTGNTVGYTQFAAASKDGSRSTTVSISLQRTHKMEGQNLAVFQALQRAEQAAVCLAMDGS